MTDYTRDTPALGRMYCPGCEAEADPTREILDVRWCDQHPPNTLGADDPSVTADYYATGSAECGGVDNRRWCALFHARRP